MSLAQRARWRRLGRGALFRALAVLVGLSPLLAAELALRALDLGRPNLHEDPFVGFSAMYPLFVKSPDGQRYETSRTFRRFFRPVSFDTVKAPNEFRIFCLGGSSVQGRPFSVETSFTSWLELSLNAADPSKKWKVVNCGGVSYATYRLAPMMEELLQYQPDMFVVYEGHNEFLEDRSYAGVKQVPDAIRTPMALLSRLRSFGVLHQAVASLRGSSTDEPAVRPLLPPEVEALLDYKGGLEAYHRDDRWRAGVIRHFEFNLRRMVALARQAGVPIVLVNPVYNLDHPPFKSEHRPGLSPGDRKRFEGLWDAARAQYDRSLPAAIGLLKQAIAIDDQHAGIHFTLAKCYQQLGRYKEARAEFLLAKDLDICPLRVLEPMNQIMLTVARETHTPLVDLVELFEDRSLGGIIGSDWLVDHVHPSIKGHQLIAGRFMELLQAQGWVHPQQGWEAIRDLRYQKRMASLDAFYYLKAQQRLGNLRMWAAGLGNLARTKPVRIGSEPTPAADPSEE